MPDAESFVAAVAANPVDDLPRLVFADWLDENGDPARAGFIRDHVRLAKLRPGTDEFKSLFRRCADTLKANLPAWIKPACDAFGQPTDSRPGPATPPNLSVYLEQKSPPHALYNPTFSRGFIEAAQIQFRNVQSPESLNRFFREHPVTRLVADLDDSPEHWAKIVTPALNRVRAIDIVCVRPQTISAVFGSPVWDGVRRTTFHVVDVVEPFCRSPVARRIRWLRAPITIPILYGLAEFPLDDQLQEFAPTPLLLAVRPTPDEWSALSRVSFRPTLKRLDLTRCGMTDDGLAAFARGEEWVRLQGLKLGGNLFGDRGWADFCRGWRTPELTYLDASRNRLTDSGAEMLARSGMLKTLRVIDLRGNRITGRGAVALARAVAEGKVNKLLLAGNPLGKREVANVKGLLGGRTDIG